MSRNYNTQDNMMSEQAKLYMVLKNTSDERCIFLTPEKPYPINQSDPEIIYDGGEHAILYRNKDNAIILDYYPESERSHLKSVKEILVVEYDVITNQPNNEYMARVSMVKTLPDITKGLITPKTQKK